MILAPHIVGMRKKDLGLPRYEDATERRCRAESIACLACGPRSTFSEPGCTDWQAIVAAAGMLREGKIVEKLLA